MKGVHGITWVGSWISSIQHSKSKLLGYGLCAESTARAGVALKILSTYMGVKKYNTWSYLWKWPM